MIVQTKQYLTFKDVISVAYNLDVMPSISQYHGIIIMRTLLKVPFPVVIQWGNVANTRIEDKTVSQEKHLIPWRCSYPGYSMNDGIVDDFSLSGLPDMYSIFLHYRYSKIFSLSLSLFYHDSWLSLCESWARLIYTTRHVISSLYSISVSPIVQLLIKYGISVPQGEAVMPVAEGSEMCVSLCVDKDILLSIYFLPFLYCSITLLPRI